MDPCILEHLNRTLTIYPFDKIVDGDSTYGDPIEIKVYYEPKVELVRNARGQEVVSTGIIIIDGSDANKITKNDKLLLDFTGEIDVITIGAFQSLDSTTEWDHLEVRI